MSVNYNILDEGTRDIQAFLPVVVEAFVCISCRNVFVISGDAISISLYSLLPLNFIKEQMRETFNVEYSLAFISVSSKTGVVT